MFQVADPAGSWFVCVHVIPRSFAASVFSAIFKKKKSVCFREISKCKNRFVKVMRKEAIFLFPAPDINFKI
jgi:hypothetical protein